MNKVLTFDSKPWLRPYIEKNTSMRAKATSKFEKDLCKLGNNSVFGKQIENVRKRINVKFATNPQKYINKPTFKNIKNLDDLYLVEQAKKSVKLDKPIYGGLSILDVSKILLPQFHLRMKEKFPNSKLLFTDTDSLCYWIQEENLYEKMKDDPWMDYSNYPKTNPNFSENHKSIPGYFKDETEGIPISKFIGLRSKQYCYIHGDKTIKKCKGITKQGMKNIAPDDYEKTLNAEISEGKFTTMNIIRSHDHTLYTEKVTKKALDRNDNKRLILENGIDTVPFGYY